MPPSARRIHHSPAPLHPPGIRAAVSVIVASSPRGPCRSAASEWNLAGACRRTPFGQPRRDEMQTAMGYTQAMQRGGKRCDFTKSEPASDVAHFERMSCFEMSRIRVAHHQSSDNRSGLGRPQAKITRGYDCGVWTGSAVTCITEFRLDVDAATHPLRASLPERDRRCLPWHSSFTGRSSTSISVTGTRWHIICRSRDASGG